MNIIAKLATENGGVSYCPYTGEMNPTTGYMVSIMGREKIVDELTDEVVRQYLQDNFIHITPTTYFGAWFNDGKWYLDVSMNIQDRDIAIGIAQKNEQLAIWDCSSYSNVYLAAIAA